MMMQNLPTGTVTLLFTDIAGSTDLLAQLGERYVQALSECRQVLRTAFGQWNGNVVDTQSDAFFVVFARAILPFTPLAGYLGFTPLPGLYFLFLVAMTVTYLLLVEVVKRRLMRRLLI
jgi:hypothetical protein